MDFINSMDYQGKILQLRTLFSELSVEECVKNFMAVVSGILGPSPSSPEIPYREGILELSSTISGLMTSVKK